MGRLKRGDAKLLLCALAFLIFFFQIIKGIVNGASFFLGLLLKIG